MEKAEAHRRELDDCFRRALELIYISSIPVNNILDFGCGVGRTVRLLRETLGLNAVGVDPFGDFEPTEFLHKMDLAGLQQLYHEGFFDAIYSIEVFEHLEDPKEVVQALSRLMKPGGRILVNTGTQEFLAETDPDQNYIDPVRRGHISIYSLPSMTRLAVSVGMSARFLARRNYILLLEPAGSAAAVSPLPENLAHLRRLGGEWFTSLFGEYMRLVLLEEEMGNEILGWRKADAALREEFDERGRWALALDREVNELRRQVAVNSSLIAAPRQKICGTIWTRLLRRMAKPHRKTGAVTSDH
jgi:SAM-dependent methyltransferase